MPMCRRKMPPSGRDTMPSSSTSDPMRPACVAGTLRTLVRMTTTQDPTTSERPKVAICTRPSSQSCGESSISPSRPGEAAPDEPVNEMSDGNLHGGVSRKDAGGQKAGQGLVEAEFAHERKRQRGVIGVIGGIGESHDAAAENRGALRLVWQCRGHCHIADGGI